MRRRLEVYPWGGRLLTAAEECDLARRIRAGDEEARAEMAACNLPLAMTLAGRYARKHNLDTQDAFGAAQIGLVKAIDRFDPGRGCKFSTYALQWIRAAIQYHCIRHRGALSVPHHHARAHAKVPPAFLALAAKSLGARSLDWAPEPGSPPFSETIADGSDPAHAIEEADEIRADLALIAPAFAGLSGREAAVLRRRYALDGGPPATIRELAEEQGVSRQMIRAVHERALEKIRAYLRTGRIKASRPGRTA